MKNFYIIMSSLFIILLVIAVAMEKGNIITSRDTEECLQRIYNEFDRKYTTSFEFSESYYNEASEQTIYCFKWSEDDSVVVKATAGWTFDGILTFLPQRYVSDDFSKVLKEYIINNECGGVLDITDVSIEEATQMVYDLIGKTQDQMSLYHKDEAFYTDDIRIVLIYNAVSEEEDFYAYNKSTIHDQIVNTISNSRIISGMVNKTPSIHNKKLLIIEVEAI